MRVLQLIDSLEAGGAERMAVNLANTLSESIEGSYLCATRQEGLLKAALHPKVNYLFLNKRAKLDRRAIMTLYRYLKTEQITIVHAHSTSFFMATLMTWMLPNLNIVWHDHYGNSSHLEARQYKVLRFCSGYFSLILSVNHVLEAWAKAHLNCDKVAYVANFAITEPTRAPVTLLKGLQGKRILCLANLRAQKDHLTLMNAFKLVQAHYPEWTLHCVGQDFKDAYSQSVFNLVEELHLESQVFFYGSCPDSTAIIAQSDLGVLSSASEGLPLALLEYGLGQLPMVATDVGDCSSVLPTTCQEYLVPPQNPELLAAQIRALIGDHSQRKSVGHLINHHVLSGFSATAVKDKLIAYYSQL
ncbi:glycosyltransferase [Gelidibacter salicanalis]|uniref:Glycosyltransferase n=1 Tax=Gelidibacter salicanalis TaxID=291193 RepID=A0A934KTP4_9FLAO|nr:glycosyltransferase [Gelidibacter salicanalis]MBJ7880563.1 glycosyltransferase [Gelidibacter salicanalis]